MSRLNVFLLRAGLGFVSGWFLNLVFFSKLSPGQAIASPKDWFIATVLGAIVLGAAYMSESLRKRGE